MASGGGGKTKKMSIIDKSLPKLMDKEVRIKFSGGREVTGILKGFDPLVNLVLDNVTEFVRDEDDPDVLSDKTRPLGLTVCRGTQVVLICPTDGMEAIENPFAQE